MSDEEYERKIQAFKEKQAAAATPTDATNKPLDKPSNTEIGLRGAGSGFLMSYEPQIVGGIKGLMPGTTMAKEIEAERQRNDAAFNANPALYGSAYAGGTGANMYLTGGLSALAKAPAVASKLAPWASKAEVAKEALGRFGAGGAEALGASAIKPTVGNVTGAAVRATGTGINMPATPRTIDNQIEKNIMGVPLSQNEEQPKPGFGKLSNFLAQARDSANPEVQTAAEQAQSAVDPNDPDAKRKIAMILQQTPAGRAVGNSASSLNEQA